MSVPRTPPELLVSLLRVGEYLVSNPFTRTYAVVDEAALAALAALREPEPDTLSRLETGSFRARDATESPFGDGLLGDPTGVERAASLGDTSALSLEQLLELARRLFLVVEDERAYADYFGPRTTILDRAHRGNLHQRVGEHVLLELRRRELDEWWADQKFTPDRRCARPGPYEFVQERFMEAQFPVDTSIGRTLDFGCGPGLFARFFARRGAEVLGLDTDERHLETGRALAAEDGLADKIDFRPLDLPPERTLDPLRESGERFDLVFLSDVLMFYFFPYGAERLDPVALLRNLSALLAPGGRIAVLEPQGTFWQQPWLGEVERPFTVLTEYSNRRYGVTPTLEQLARAAEEAGLAITRIREPVATGSAPEGYERAHAFAAEFPLWWYFELRRL